MPEPVGFSTAVPMTGQFFAGKMILFVASTEKLNPVGLVKENLSLPPANVAPAIFARMGAGMLNDELVIPVRPLDVKEMVAPVTAFVLKAVKLVKVAVPETAAITLVPPKVQVPWTAEAVILAVLVVALP